MKTEKSKEKKPSRNFKKGLLFCLLYMLQAAVVAQVPQTNGTTAKLTLRIEEISSSRGHIRIAVFDKAAGFPAAREEAFRIMSVPAKKGRLQLELEAMPAGKYAIAVLHDQNENGMLDTNLLGYPLEGYGFSNNKLPLFRSPTFNEASFELKHAAQNLLIVLRN